MIVCGTCLIRHYAAYVVKMTPSPYANDTQTFYESGGEGLAARRFQGLEIFLKKRDNQIGIAKTRVFLICSKQTYDIFPAVIQSE